MSGALLLSTDLRTGYADAAELGAAIAAGTHPLFAPSSDFDEEFVAFDDVVTYQGRGTVRVAVGAWLDAMRESALTDVWIRMIQRWSPTYDTVPGVVNFGLGLGMAMYGPILYNTNDGEGSYSKWQDVELVRASADPADGYRTILTGGDEPRTELTDRPLSLAELRNGAWRVLDTHFTRNGTFGRSQFWLDGLSAGRQNIDLPNDPFHLLEIPFYGDKDGSPENPYDNDNDFVHLALIEAYAGGDPYGLLAQMGSRARAGRNARRIALGLLRETVDDPTLEPAGV